MPVVQDEYLVDRCCIDRHVWSPLDDRRSLYHVSDDGIGSIHIIHWCVVTMDIV